MYFYLAKNNPIIDLGIAIEQAYQEALKNGFEGTKDEFIRTAPESLLREFLNSGGKVRENSYAQLIDDYDNNIQVLTIDGEKESLTWALAIYLSVIQDAILFFSFLISDFCFLFIFYPGDFE